MGKKINIVKILGMISDLKTVISVLEDGTIQPAEREDLKNALADLAEAILEVKNG